MRELEHLNIELSGTNLIEASAGTGKTYAITCLYLRLLIERELTPDQILVVTFTEAATEELRGRIRDRIREALEVFGGKPVEDPFLLGLSADAREPGRDEAMARLDQAIKAFDTASIFTIHGFCLRAIQDNAFESGSLYDTELVSDPSHLLQETVDDFWRITFFGDQAPLLNAALGKGWSPASLVSFVRPLLDNPKLAILPDLAAWDRERLDRDCREAFEEVARLWQGRREEVSAILENDQGLSRSKENYPKDILPQLFAAMDAFTSGDNPYELFVGFGKLSTSGLNKGKKPKGQAPAHPLFDACERLDNLVAKRLLLLKWELVEFCRERLPLRKKEANVRFFSDLLNELYAALSGGNGDLLAASLRSRYRAAMIDEFQDTDPVQFEIFRKIYAHPETPLFLIGDPKQAIYSFRGADVFAYMEASRSVACDRRFTLTRNWRSTPSLLDAFNTLFENERKPFLFDAIAYHPIRSGRQEPDRVLVLEGADAAPLQIWTLPAGEDGEPLNVGKANKAVQHAVAAEIARLLRDAAEGRARIVERSDGRSVDRPVVPSDIAVIVRSHFQGGLIQEALRERGIPSVMRSDQTIFETNEAKEVCALLAAVADPWSEHRVRAALATGIMGRTGNDLALMLEDEKSWEACLEQFRDYHRSWRDLGFMVMARTLMDREGVRGRLLRRPDGERRLTNLLHCFEVIHHAAHEGRLGMESLLTWFGDKVAAGERSEEYQIRLETDEKAVKIVTIHVSKGLEYPIVFCPYLWGGTRTDAGIVTFHDGHALVRDFGSDRIDRHRLLADKESLAEGLRLLYVALTRARYRCYLVAGKIDGRRANSPPETSPVACLLYAPPEIKIEEDLVSRLVSEVGGLSAADMDVRLRQRAGKAAGSISVTPMPPPESVPPPLPVREERKPLSNREFKGIIEQDWRVASFTSFAGRDPGVADFPDRDETSGDFIPPLTPVAAEPPRGRSIFTFPKGVQAGIFLHGLFEKLDFCAADREQVAAFVRKWLAQCGYDPEWEPHLCRMVDAVLAAPLPAAGGVFSLSGLKRGCWITELEFFFPLRFITSERLRRCLREWSGGTAGVDLSKVCAGFGFRPVRGMLRGFMDLDLEHDNRFYLLDWKSNHLGNRPEDYGPAQLARAMEQHLYPLQYLLYTVALNRYLKLRVKGYDYETHFGGVFYVFLRGVNPENGGETGIFTDLPPAPLVRRLTELLVEAELEEGEACMR